VHILHVSYIHSYVHAAVDVVAVRIQAEAEQLRAAAERALSDVKTGARAAISDMAQRHEQDLLAARAAAAEEVQRYTIQ
jgi:hypothetical protein